MEFPRNQDIATLCINTIRTLSIDAVQAANSGHPGAPMALAPLAYVLWNRVMRFDPADPIWPGLPAPERDRHDPKHLDQEPDRQRRHAYAFRSLHRLLASATVRNVMAMLHSLHG